MGVLMEVVLEQIGVMLVIIMIKHQWMSFPGSCPTLCITNSSISPL